MSAGVRMVRAIYELLQIDPSFTLTKARAKYREAFGIRHDDESIDKEYMWCVARHLGSPRMFSWCAPDVAIPLRIALAMLLRESSVRKKRKGLKSQKTPLMLRLGEIAQMEEAQRLKSEIMKRSVTRRGRDFQPVLLSDILSGAGLRKKHQCTDRFAQAALRLCSLFV